jgi:hypothetical protein
MSTASRRGRSSRRARRRQPPKADENAPDGGNLRRVALDALPHLIAVLLAGLLLWTAGRTAPGLSRLSRLGQAVAALGVTCLVAYLGLGLSVLVWSDRPQLARAVTLGLLAAVVGFAGVHALHGPDDDRPGAEDDEGGEGGGGEPRLPPAPTPPSPPAGIQPDWQRFDEARDGWERTPVA